MSKNENKVVVFLQQTPSQVDVPFYSYLNKITEGRVVLIYLNNEGIYRTKPDPELGVIPVYGSLKDDFDMYHYSSKKIVEVAAKIKSLQPSFVVIQDLPSSQRLFFSIASKIIGATAILRTDVNILSDRDKNIFKLIGKKLMLRIAFDGLAPVSSLTSEYLSYKNKERIWPMPYATDRVKFGISKEKIEAGRLTRAKLKIREDDFVFLAVTKFSARENPIGILEAYSIIAKSNDHVKLILIGSGPQTDLVKSFISESNITSIISPGYVNYDDLEDYFFASDCFIHLPITECWGVSPQDALVAHKAIICSSRTGSGNIFLTGNLSRYLVPPDKPIVTAGIMQSLVSDPHSLANFEPAWRLAECEYTAQASAEWWARKMQFSI